MKDNKIDIQDKDIKTRISIIKDNNMEINQ